MPADPAVAVRPPLKFGKRLSYLAQTGLLFSVLGIFRLFGIDRASDAGAWFGRNVLARLIRSRSTVETVRTAFPDLDDAGVAALLTGMWENIGRNLAEYAWLEELAAEADTRFTWEGVENLDAARAKGRPFIVVTGHFANWEMAFVAIHHLGMRGAVVTRPPNNPWVADWIAEKRRRVGLVHQIPKGAAGTRQIFATLRGGTSVGFLIDQHLAEGIPVPLFGRDAMTTHAPAALAVKLGLDIVPYAVRRTAGAHYHAVFYPAISATGAAGAAQDILAMTAEINRFVEAEVRRAPAHWLWMHRRWKPVGQLTRRAGRVLDEAAGPAR